MDTKIFDTLVEALNDLKIKGYTHNFEIQKDGVFCIDEKKKFLPSGFTVEKTFRFEGMTNPDDSSILYAVKTNCGIKGAFVENYSIHATTLTQEMSEKLQFKLEDGMVRPEDI
ncbi:MAG: hypothetical protein ACI9XO_003964 [Paraglaciecola sp.]|jgi:hypothetical protein